jgi:hypothetical protein
VLCRKDARREAVEGSSHATKVPPRQTPHCLIIVITLRQATLHALDPRDQAHTSAHIHISAYSDRPIHKYRTQKLWQNGRQSFPEKSRGLCRVPQCLTHSLPRCTIFKASSGEGRLQADKGMRYWSKEPHAVLSTCLTTILLSGTRPMVFHPATRRQVLPHTQYEHDRCFRNRQWLETWQPCGHGWRPHRFAMPSHQACLQAQQRGFHAGRR